jgi:hypothetical protein
VKDVSNMEMEITPQANDVPCPPKMITVCNWVSSWKREHVCVLMSEEVFRFSCWVYLV